MSNTVEWIFISLVLSKRSLIRILKQLSSWLLLMIHKIGSLRLMNLASTFNLTASSDLATEHITFPWFYKRHHTSLDATTYSGFKISSIFCACNCLVSCTKQTTSFPFNITQTILSPAFIDFTVLSKLYAFKSVESLIL